MPYFGDASGHPPLIPCRYKNDILDLESGSTLRNLFWSHKEQIIPLKMYDRGVLMDADDKKGYEEVYQKQQTQQIPDKIECSSIINERLRNTALQYQSQKNNR